MKLQYFGDRRDFYKYDLLLELGRALQPPNGINVLPMLTADDGGNDGQLTGRVSARDATLFEFLRAGGPRQLGRVAEHFTQRGVPLRFVSEELIRKDDRAGYFARIEDQALADSIVFLDPDTGLKSESASRLNTRYLRYDELQTLFARMSSETVLVIYQ
ncbi:hypothetical protein B1A_07306, partial [mine drainage metagenome]